MNFFQENERMFRFYPWQRISTCFSKTEWGFDISINFFTVLSVQKKKKIQKRFVFLNSEMFMKPAFLL